MVVNRELLKAGIVQFSSNSNSKERKSKLWENFPIYRNIQNQQHKVDACKIFDERENEPPRESKKISQRAKKRS